MPEYATTAVKQYLGRTLRPYWSTTERTYAGFTDPAYALLTAGTWQDLVESAPVAGYRENVFDCEDIAMQFKVHAALRQMAECPDATTPFGVGLAAGCFDWVDHGQTLHAANFALLQETESDDWQLVWFDLRRRRAYPFTAIRPGLVWILL